MIEQQSQFSYRMPAEWEPHSAVWVAWPCDKITFGSLNQKDNKINPNRLVKVENKFTEIISALEANEQVRLLVRDREWQSRIPKGAKLFQIDYADVWTRDYFPTFVKNQAGDLKAIKWKYDAYGKKFKSLIKDNDVWPQVNDLLNIKTLEPNVILETGAIDVNGSGILLTTEQCLLARNPKVSKSGYERIFAEYLGVSKVIWLKQGLVNDHTDGHIDEIARFVSSNKIVCAFEDDRRDENYLTLKNNYENLVKETNLEGEPFDVIKLPMPHMQYDDGNKAPVSYCNFYIGNKVILAALYNDKNDSEAMSIIQSCFPDRKVIGVDCSEIIYGGGAVHCLTQQMPA